MPKRALPGPETPLTAAQIERQLRQEGFRPTDPLTRRRLAKAGCLGLPGE